MEKQDRTIITLQVLKASCSLGHGSLHSYSEKKLLVAITNSRNFFRGPGTNLGTKCRFSSSAIVPGAKERSMLWGSTFWMPTNYQGRVCIAKHLSWVKHKPQAATTCVHLHSHCKQVQQWVPLVSILGWRAVIITFIDVKNVEPTS